MLRFAVLALVAAMPVATLAAEPPVVEPLVIPQGCDSEQSYLFNDKFNPNWTGSVADGATQQSERPAQQTQPDK